MEDKSFLYILTNQFNSTFHVGVTNNLLKKVYEHKRKKPKNPLSTYYFSKLVYFEEFSSIDQAFSRERDLNKENNEKKISLIEKINPEWEDLYTKLS